MLLLQWRDAEPLVRAEEFTADFAARLGRKAPRDPALVFLAIDNASVSLDAIDLEPLYDLRAADLAGLLAFLLWLKLPRPLVRALGLFIACEAVLAITFAIWNWGDLLLPAVAPLGALGIGGIGGLICDLVTERRGKGRVRQTLERYVSHNVVSELLENPAAYTRSLGGIVKPATILFSDIRNFTRVSAETDPHLLVAQLNEYITAMVECVFRFNGTLDKFIGDAVMAVWGNAASAGPAADARNAVRCALAMRDELGKLNAGWSAAGRQPLEIGIALNHGDVIVGNIGSPQRMEFTVIGDAVNVTWRLQERTKIHRSDLLVGESMTALIAPDFATEPLGQIKVGELIETKYARVLTDVPVVADSADLELVASEF